MALASGTRLGSYEISDLLGKGGMGEVYRARDTKLGREVAIKVLPSEFSQDEERLARLEREARMLAALNHPNIAAIHGLEESDHTRFLVMELVEGDTLADRIKRGAVPVEESLELGLQIAEALEAAHEKSVVHRDLKPANIKITPQGNVKVLDFGLAKAFVGDEADLNLSNSPTLSMAATQAGLILGTAAYMSPEQASGEIADHRSDVWSFGVVLYEILSGQQLFTGKTVSHVMGAVLERTPDWTRLPANLHPRIRFLLERCLEKDSKNRCPAIGEVRSEIAKALSEPEAVTVAASVAPDQGRRVLVATAIVVVGLVGGVAGWMLRPEAPQPVGRFAENLAGVLTPVQQNLAISPDGRLLAYSTPTGIYLRSIDAFESRRIPGTEGPSVWPRFSPDGEWIAYATLEGLKKIPVIGGAPLTLADSASGAATGFSWDADDMLVGGLPAGGIFSASSDGGEPEILLEAPGVAGSPQLLPGGEAILYGTPDGQIILQSLGGASEPSQVAAGFFPRYLETGHLIYANDGVLFAVPVDIGSFEATDGPVPVIESVQGGQFAISDSGTLIYVSGAQVPETRVALTWVDRNGGRSEIPVPPRTYRAPKISPDGSRLVVSTVEPDEEAAIWVYNLDGATQMQRMTGGGNNIAAIWHPDGNRLVFNSDRDGSQRIYWQEADLSGSAVPLTPGEPGVTQEPTSWSPDGRTLAFWKGPTPRSIWTVSIGEDGQPSEPERFAGGTLGIDTLSPAFSPDGEWLAYLSVLGPGDEQLFMEPFPATGAGTRFQLTENGAGAPVWSPDGQELFYRRGLQTLLGLGGDGALTPTLYSVGVTLGQSPQWSPERTLPIEGFEVRARSGPAGGYDIAPDGERFVMAFTEDAPQALGPQMPRLSIVLNWFEELKERVPVP